MRSFRSSWARRTLFALLSFTGLASTSSAHALVSTPVGGRAGQVDANLKATFERGKIEPNDNEDSWQSANWEIYAVGGGYTFGDTGPLKDLFARIEYSWYDAPAEVVPVNGARAPTACGGRVLSNGKCQVHPSDRGSIITPQLGFNVIHDADYAFGFFLLGNIPLDVNFDKFVLPRTDAFGGGPAWGVSFSEVFSYEGRLFIGSGPLNGKQNATVALITNFKLEAKQWLLPDPVGISFGPYFDGDLTERFDDNYDNTFVAGVPTTSDGSVSGPGDTRARIRMMRFGFSLSPYLRIGKSIAIEANYTQKLFGYDTPATQFYSVGLRAAY